MSDDLFQILNNIAEHSVSLRRGEPLFHREDRVERMYLLIEGGVNLIRHQADGKRIILHHTSSGHVLAEASFYSDRYHCDGVCTIDSTFKFFRKDKFESLLTADDQIAYKWGFYLARTLQEARFRVELLTRKTVTDRLAGWLEMNGDELPPRGKWKDIASAINVTPEALYRALRKMKVAKTPRRNSKKLSCPPITEPHNS